jgi:hypothetical protein
VWLRGYRQPASASRAIPFKRGKNLHAQWCLSEARGFPLKTAKTPHNQECRHLSSSAVDEQPLLQLPGIVTNRHRFSPVPVVLRASHTVQSARLRLPDLAFCTGSRGLAEPGLSNRTGIFRFWPDRKCEVSGCGHCVCESFEGTSTELHSLPPIAQYLWHGAS